MATTPKVLFRGAATTSVGTVLYTTPAATTTIVSNIAVTNTSTAGTFTLSLDGVLLADTLAIAADSTVFIDLKQVLGATDEITGGASAITINFHISGVEIS